MVFLLKLGHFCSHLFNHVCTFLIFILFLIIKSSKEKLKPIWFTVIVQSESEFEPVEVKIESRAPENIDLD